MSCCNTHKITSYPGRILSCTRAYDVNTFRFRTAASTTKTKTENAGLTPQNIMPPRGGGRHGGRAKRAFDSSYIIIRYTDSPIFRYIRNIRYDIRYPISNPNIDESCTAFLRFKSGTTQNRQNLLLFIGALKKIYIYASCFLCSRVKNVRDNINT